MKNLPLLLLLLTTACTPDPPPPEQPATQAPAPEYPATLTAILDAHGGLKNWQALNTLTFSFPRGEDALENQTVDLSTRRELIEQPGTTIGYDGEKSWVVAEEDYDGDPLFYRNLMFYFYAMPFVLADPGINYAPATPLEFGDKTYPGLKISYDEGVGLSPKDNYFLHFDPDTKQMRWLGYTVTYRSGEVSDKVSWIEYPKWSAREGVVLPDELVWYNVEDGLPTEPRNARQISGVSVSRESMEEDFYARREGAEVF